MTRCYDEGPLRAYLDGALPADEHAAVAAHLSGCPACQDRVEELRRLAAQVGALLATPALTPDPRAALARFEDGPRAPRPAGALAGSQESRAGARPGSLDTNLSRRNGMSIKDRVWSSPRRPLFAGLAVLLVLLGLLALPPVRAAADQLLDVFRVQKVLFVPTSADRIAQLQNLKFDQNTLFVAKPRLINQPAQPRTVESAAAASAAAGFTFREPTVFPAAPTSKQFVVRDRSVYQFQADVNASRQLLALMGVDDVSLPDALGAGPITADLPAWGEARYQGSNYELTLYEGRSPSVTLPDGVDIRLLGKAALRLLGMDSEQAETLSRQIDWTSTLIFPFPTDLSDMEIRQVTIGDAQGLLVRYVRENRSYWQLYWQGGDHFYVLQSRGRVYDYNMIAAAESIR